eukprot:Skav235292  [mRNA]  locus=scaffold4363:42576:52230:- [translate_table: standard]
MSSTVWHMDQAPAAARHGLSSSPFHRLSPPAVVQLGSSQGTELCSADPNGASPGATDRRDSRVLVSCALKQLCFSLVLQDPALMGTLHQILLPMVSLPALSKAGLLWLEHTAWKHFILVSEVEVSVVYAICLFSVRDGDVAKAHWRIMVIAAAHPIAARAAVFGPLCATDDTLAKTFALARASLQIVEEAIRRIAASQSQTGFAKLQMLTT